MPAGDDRVIYEAEDIEVLCDIERYEAVSKTSDDLKYARLKRRLGFRGFSFIKHGKNRSLDGTVDNVEISLSHNYKLNRHRFDFVFPKEFKTMECYLFIHKFLKKDCIDNPDDYAIGIVASSEFGIDEKNVPPGLGPEYILNLVKAARKSRSKFELFVQFRDEITQKLMKIYLKENGKTVRTETKMKYLEPAAKLIEQYKTEKDAALDIELQDQIWRELILSILESIEAKVENNAASNFQQNQEILKQNHGINENMSEMKEDQITMFYQLDQLRHREQKDNEILANQTEILLKYAENQAKMIETQDLLIKNILLLQDNLTRNYETLFYQNREIMAELSKPETRMKESGVGFKLKSFFKKIIKKLKRK
jgi:hypothetical protein